MTDELPDLGPLYERHDAENASWRSTRRHIDMTIAWELIEAERKHFEAQAPADFDVANRPRPGTIVVDKDGDGWVFGRTRWTQISGNDDKYLRFPGLKPESMYGPYRIIGRERSGDKPTEWTYRTVRPKKR